MNADARLAPFIEALPHLDAWRRRAALDLQGLLETNGVQFQFVTSRTKSPESLRAKLARPDKTYQKVWDVTDIVGLRIATYFEDTIDDVARLIEQTWRVDYQHSTDKLRFTDHGRFGYRSLHYVCAAPVDAGLDGDFRFEIQVRTALQHAWAEVEHDLGYKANASVPELIRRRFSRIASLLEIADQEFVSIKTDLAAYRHQVRAELLHPNRPLPLDVVSLAEVVETSAVVDLDAAIAAALGKAVIREPWNPGYLVTLLQHAGLMTTRDVQDALARHSADATCIVEPYFRFTTSTWGFDGRSIDGVQRGYGLFFLAHVALLQGSALGINKVARLAQAYRELDHPDDLQTAQHFASGLAAALAPVLDGR